MLFKHEVTSWPVKNFLVVNFSEAKTCKGLTYKVLHLCTGCSCKDKCHLAGMLIKTRLTLNDVTGTMYYCVSVIARF